MTLTSTSRQTLRDLGVAVPRGRGTHAGGGGGGCASAVRWLQECKEASHKDQLYANLLAVATTGKPAAGGGGLRGGGGRKWPQCGDDAAAEVLQRLRFLPATAIVRSAAEAAAAIPRLTRQHQLLHAHAGAMADRPAATGTPPPAGRTTL